MAKKARSKSARAVKKASKARPAKRARATSSKKGKPRAPSSTPADQNLLNQLMGRIEELETNRALTQSLAAVAPSSSNVGSTPVASTAESSLDTQQSRVDAIISFHNTRDDFALRSEQRAAQTATKAKAGKFASSDNLLLASLKQQGDHLFDERNERRQKNPKVVRLAELVRAVAFDSKLRVRETENWRLALDRLEYVELLAESANRFQVPAVVRFDEWNRMVAASSRRHLMDYTPVQYTKIFSGDAVRPTPSKSKSKQTKNGSKTTTPVCIDYLRGRCTRGTKCKYRHIDSTRNAPTRGRAPRDGRE